MTLKNSMFNSRIGLKFRTPRLRFKSIELNLLNSVLILALCNIFNKLILIILVV